MESESSIKIGEYCNLKKLKINEEINGNLTIGKRLMCKGLILYIKVNSNLYIGERVWFGEGVNITSYIDSIVDIGDDTSLGANGTLTSSSNSKILIGRDCMISFNFLARTYDDHPYYDILTKKCLNDTSNGFSVILKDHVWIGQNVILIKGAEVGKGSIVGTGALVSKKFPNNVTIGGNPAKILRKNICWKRDENYPFEEEYCKETVEV